MSYVRKFRFPLTPLVQVLSLFIAGGWSSAHAGYCLQGTVAAGTCNVYSESGSTGGSLTNTGLIKDTLGTMAPVYLDKSVTGFTFTNEATGVLVSTYAVGYSSYGQSNTIVNHGQMTGSGGGLGLGTDSSTTRDASTVSIVNTGTIGGSYTLGGTTYTAMYGVMLLLQYGAYSNLVGTVDNSGTITGTLFGFQNGGNNGGGQSRVNQLINSGTISGTGASGDGLVNQYTLANIGSLQNSGTISGARYGIFNQRTATITSLVNTGTISGGTYGLMNDSGAVIASLINQGTIQGGIFNQASTITTLSNAQAGLSYRGVLPVNYNVMLGGTANLYGTLQVTNGSGSMNFGIASGSTVKSNLYAGVLSGVTAGQISGGTSGTFGGYDYTLQLHSGSTTVWDLLFPAWSDVTYGSATTNLKNTPAAGAAAVLDSHAGVASAFNVKTEQDYNRAATQAMPLLTGGSMVAATAAATGINRVVQARIEANRGLSSGEAFLGDKNVWLKPFGSWADQGDVRGVSGYQSSTYGVIAGVDGVWSPLLRVGGAFAYAKSSVDSNSSEAPQHYDVDVYQLIGYGSYSLDERTDLNFQADVGQNRNEGRRVLTQASSVASSNYDSHSLHVGAGVGRVFQLDERLSLTPSLRADYTWVQDDGYTETGAGALNLAVDRRSTDTLVLGAEGRLAYQWSAWTTLLLNAGVGYDTLNKGAAITAAFAGAPGAAFVTYGLPQNPWIGHVGLGLTQKVGESTEVTARYDAEARSHFLNQTASVKARWAF